MLNKTYYHLLKSHKSILIISILCCKILISHVFGVENIPLGQRVISTPPREPIRNIIGGFYSQNVTLYFRNSPYRVNSELIIESSATLTIETGVQLYFDTGVGIKVFGTIKAIGNEFAHIQMLPYQEQLHYDDSFPEVRLIDGPSVRQGRLQMLFRDRWRSVCTKMTNWTSADTGVACKSMGFTDGAFWRYYLRNNDTYPLVMPTPNCQVNADSLKNCGGFNDLNLIPLTENLCQGEDDIGLYCWGPPTFSGWAKHWKGIQIFHSPFGYVAEDKNMVSVQRESLSRLEFIDILYAGYDKFIKNTTAAIHIEGIPPIINGLRIEHSARDGISFYKSHGPIIMANSTIRRNRGHGIIVEDTIDARFYLNNSIVSENYGDGIWYRQQHVMLSSMPSEWNTNNAFKASRMKRHNAYTENEDARVDMCVEHQIPKNLFFPHLIKAHFRNNSITYPSQLSNVCWLAISLPTNLQYSYTIQFIRIENKNSPSLNLTSEFVICDGNITFSQKCQRERYRIPIINGVLPQSVTIPTSNVPVLVSVEHHPADGSNFIAGDIELIFKIHASVTDKAFYGLNITNSAILNNIGNGIHALNIRDRTVLCNVSVEGNQGKRLRIAGFLVSGGAADIWINSTSLNRNWGDGVNISYAGGAINFNSSSASNNRWRGFAYHYNNSIPFLALRHEIIIKGRPANNIFYPKATISNNLWGGLLISNICLPAAFDSPKVLINWVEFTNNAYHPAMELFSCQNENSAKVFVDISGNYVQYGSGLGLRIEPCINAHVIINSNRFHNIQNSALLIRNAEHPQLVHFPAEVFIYKNDIKMNIGLQFIVSIGLNEDSLHQRLIFDQQNEIRMNTVINPFPFLKARTAPYAAVIVSSSNVFLKHNCFGNPNADYEIATDLMEHAKQIDARHNNWGSSQPEVFMPRIFDQFKRYSLATIFVDPFSAVCNHRLPTTTYLQQYYRSFRQKTEKSHTQVIGGAIYENSDLQAGTYLVVDDLHIMPGAKLTLASGTKLEFMNGVGMLVQGELLRNDHLSPLLPIIFTSAPFFIPKLEKIRLVDETGNQNVIEGRLEVLINNDWGTVCNRSWTVDLAQLACNQLGLTMDRQYFENWRIFPKPGNLSMIMDNIRCEEREYDLTKCRHDGDFHNAGSKLSCRPSEVVGIRCAIPRWAGVRYSLLASPATVTGQPTMNNWIIEKAGLFDFRKSKFSPALQIDWNYHVFNGLTIRDNFQNGMEIIYNDLTKKPAVRKSTFIRNRRNGIVIRSNGITIEKVVIENNGNAGIRYNARIEASLQRDITSWLDGREQPELESNNIYYIPAPVMPSDIESTMLKRTETITKSLRYNNSVHRTIADIKSESIIPAFTWDSTKNSLQVFESQLNHRAFLVAKPNADCPIEPITPCSYELTLQAIGHQFGLEPKLAIQIVNRWHNTSDEDIEFCDKCQSISTHSVLTSVRRHTSDFPIVTSGPTVRLKYTRSYGPPAIVLLVLFLDAQEYLDRFVHVYDSSIKKNQYGVSAVYYNNLTMSEDASIILRQTEEKLWFQKVNFTHNFDAIFWVYSPQHDSSPETSIARITWHVDNCSIIDNSGPALSAHRDLFSSANLFTWNFWSNTFKNNSDSGINIQLPDLSNPFINDQHHFLMTENRFESNNNFEIRLHGYYAFVNISSNNFTDNVAGKLSGIVELNGMEKYLIMERNRFLNNKGKWMVRIETQSQSLYNGTEEGTPGFIQYNYYQFNHFLSRFDDYIDMWPRSYVVGIFGTQKIEVHFNRFRNVLMDFELVAGCTPQLPGVEFMNVSHNWWGLANEAEISQRIFDLDDWNIYTVAAFSPYYTTEELFIDFWWNSNKGQLSYANYVEPNNLDLKGRMFVSKTLKLETEQWYSFPYYYRPFRPYRITRDLTIMPNATLTIERNVEIHVWPNVRILVLGNLIADGTLWQPIRFLPINVTEYAQQRDLVGTRYRRNLRNRSIKQNTMENMDVYRDFPEVRREYPFLQEFSIFLMNNNSSKANSGFLLYYNETTGEFIPSCDRRFTVRNAQVVCRELGFDADNAYHWLTPRWDYNPQIRILKAYVEPRECRGTESRLDKCELRLSADVNVWQCVDSEHFNYIYCGSKRAIPSQYQDHWGGITIASTFDYSDNKEASVLRHVEIMGAGLAHGDTIKSAALQIVSRSVVLENINITNSAMHGLQIIMPTGSITANRINISRCHGQGMNIIAANIPSPLNKNSDSTQGRFDVPYDAPGLLNMCASGKKIVVNSRLFVYYKYDSVTVDCVKIFVLPVVDQKFKGKNIKTMGFRLLQINFNKNNHAVGRVDALSIYVGKQFSSAKLLHQYTYPLFNGPSTIVLPTSNNYDLNNMIIHLRGTASDGQYGFLAEIFVLPLTRESKNVEEVSLRESRIFENNREGFIFRNIGDIGPVVVIERNAIDDNGYFLFGNVSTSRNAIELYLHNTISLMFRSNSVCRNQGGLLVMSENSSSTSHIIIKNSAFLSNFNFSTLSFFGNDLQVMTILNNVIAHNIALYYDTVLVSRMITNFTHNLFFKNIGLHTVDINSAHISDVHQSSTIGIPAYSLQTSALNHLNNHELNHRHCFINNFFDNNIGLGHEYQYQEAFGYLPSDSDGEHGKYDEFRRRPRRQVQVINQEGVSFDWWAHTGKQSNRYRSTILIGIKHKPTFAENLFNNPHNAYELTTSPQLEYDTYRIDARKNYWGFPSTPGVAAGKIRDKADFFELAEVEYLPIFESNTSLIEGDCPAGWFQVGQEEFKSCMLFVPASMTYADAIATCESIGAFIPVLRNDDDRQREIANRIDIMSRNSIVDVERYDDYFMSYEVPLWISSVILPSHQCGWMSSRTAIISEQNCNNLLSFVCEKGMRSYQEPMMWRKDVTLTVTVFTLLIIGLLLLTLLALCKAKQRKDYFATRKSFIRESLRQSRNNQTAFESSKNNQNTKSNNNVQHRESDSKNTNNIELSCELSNSCKSEVKESHSVDTSITSKNETYSSFYCTSGASSSYTYMDDGTCDLLVNRNDATHDTSTTYCSCDTSNNSSSMITPTLLLDNDYMKNILHIKEKQQTHEFYSNNELWNDLQTSSRPDYTQRTLSEELPSSNSVRTILAKKRKEAIYANLAEVDQHRISKHVQSPELRSNNNVITSLETCM